MSVSTIATGARSTVESLTPVPAGAAQLTIASPVFFDRCLLPVQYTCQGAGISPSLDIGGLPAETQSLVVVVDDLDASNGHFIHWLAWNILPVKRLRESRRMERSKMPEVLHAAKGHIITELYKRK